MRLDHLLSKEKVREVFRGRFKIHVKSFLYQRLLFIFQCTLNSTLKKRVWLTKDGNTIDVTLINGLIAQMVRAHA